ncbi:TPA: surface lipoprotein assembly modifier [Neisseria polysaccharea]|uniref:surface lipoprotein assembly modifier n=1 Tax=Neisseria polysaccharea TaxID=489 RepID=UPI0027E0C100|nr:surface lipoprotein assembly modifier [Neisseria polysaccharea]
MFDNTVEKAQASRRYGVSLGTVKILDGGLGLKLGIGYTKRIFKAPATLIYNFTRRDDEYRMSAALWHKKNCRGKDLHPK